MPSSTPADALIRNPSALWQDPDEGIHSGVLLSDRIRFYAELVPLIYPFKELHLGPASYDLTLGSECWEAKHSKETGKTKRVLLEGEDLLIEPNSIIFVSTAETLIMPFYLVGRFNLKLRLLHEGLLVGAGPQIDPGFMGRLSCPLHNISSERISIKHGEPFAVVEFHKTTPFGSRDTLMPNAMASDVRQRGEKGDIHGFHGYPCITFPAKSLDRKPIDRYVPAGKVVPSSIQGVVLGMTDLKGELKADIDRFTKQIDRLNIYVYITMITVMISLGTYFWGALTWGSKANDSAIRAEEHVKAQERVLDLRVQEVERKLNELKETAAKAPASTSQKR